MPPYIVGIRFQRVGKIYHFDATHLPDLQPKDFVIVETSRGAQMGQVIHTVPSPQAPSDGAWKPVQRKATPRDLVLRQSWQQKEAEVLVNARSRAYEINLAGVKIVAAEFSFDGSRLSIFYGSEEDEKVDLRDLRRHLGRLYPQTQIEMHQLGPRDVAKVLGGMGACGLENRCCSRFLTDFSPISIKMAKEQGISLTPTEITGMCGRLRCCLVYEYEQYVEARAQLPKRNKRVQTPNGPGKVLDVYPLTQKIVVELDTGVRAEFARHDIEPWDELEALRQKAQAPCEKHPEGGCDCGAKSGRPEQDVRFSQADQSIQATQPRHSQQVEQVDRQKQDERPEKPRSPAHPSRSPDEKRKHTRPGGRFKRQHGGHKPKPAKGQGKPHE
jgi:cell fate regulator YaaT (PSP1 superfamily)